MHRVDFRIDKMLIVVVVVVVINIKNLDKHKKILTSAVVSHAIITLHHT